MVRDLWLGQVPMDDFDNRAACVRCEGDLDCAGAGRQQLGALVTPADDEAPRAINNEVPAAHVDAVDVETELSPGSRFEASTSAHPTDE